MVSQTCYFDTEIFKAEFIFTIFQSKYSVLIIKCYFFMQSNIPKQPPRSKCLFYPILSRKVNPLWITGRRQMEKMNNASLRGKSICVRMSLRIKMSKGILPIFLINLGMFISFLVSSRTQSLFSSVLFNLHRSVNALGFLLLLIYSLIPVRSDRIGAIISISLYLLRLGLCPTL